ncbi:MAG: putative endopeptidase [Bradyrhizobium sp.]|nr:putative endopeptidase [Bradyrhizobium sp.]
MGTALALAVFATAALGQTTAASHSGADAPKAPIVRGLDLSAIDKSADPCADFYQYACGNWVKDNPVPSDQVRWVRSFSLLQERNLYELWQELDRAATKPASPLEKKYGDFFAACMNVKELQKKGLESLKPALERISALNDSKGIATLIGDLAAAGDPAPLFGLDVEPAPMDSKKPILSISQGGLTLPDRENYGGKPYIVKRYRSHVIRVFMLTGDTLKQADSEAAAVLGIEKALAQASTNRAESADPEKRYHVLALADLKKLAPDFDFSVYFNHVTTLPIETLNVANPDFLKTVNKLIVSLPIDSWRSYFRWHILSEQAGALPKEFRDEDFAFWGANVGRQEKPAPRWRQCAAITDQAFDEALAQDWVKRNFSPAAKAGAERLVDALEKALADEIRTLPWMNDETKRTAERKLAAIQNRIGHPQKWRDYSGLKVDRHDFLGNLHRNVVFERNYMLSKLGRPVDPDEWDIAPTTLKARYARSMNSLYLPAGIIQPPFFDSAADPAVNFGGIGVLAAHELTHGFDGLGSKFDERGNARDWQTSDDRKVFAEATSCEVAQYSKLVPKSDDPGDLPTVNNLTVAESTADNGGLRIAFRALMDALVAQGRTADNKIDGYTESQRFFLSFAQISCDNQTFLSERQSMSADPHSVGRVRVNGAVQNFEEFGKAFQCAKGKPMVPGKSCRVW